MMNNDAFIGLLHDAAKGMRIAEFNESQQLTLGELILKLEAVEKKDSPVSFDFCNLAVKDLDSYRGYYDELALGFSESGGTRDVQSLIDHCKEAIGKQYEGYKGGDYIMSKNTPVWVSNYGRSGDTFITDIKDLGWRVILVTSREEV